MGVSRLESAMDAAPEYVLDVLDEIYRPPFQAIQQAVDHRWVFPNPCPLETESHEEPPIRLVEQADVIEIDGVLGLYNPDAQEITFFLKGIDRVAKILNASPKDLTFVVRLHEWAHALLHVGLQKTERDEPLRPEHIARGTAWFRGLDANLSERLPQLLTHHALCWLKDQATLPEARTRLDRIDRAFQELTRRAPDRYQIDKYSGVPKNRIIDSIGLLKSGGLIGADAWATVVTW
jgi:hypothetical protein